MKSIQLKTKTITGISATLVGKEGWLVEFSNGTRRIVPWPEFVQTLAPRGQVGRSAIESAAKALGLRLEDLHEEASGGF